MMWLPDQAFSSDVSFTLCDHTEEQRQKNRTQKFCMHFRVLLRVVVLGEFYEKKLSDLHLSRSPGLIEVFLSTLL